MRGKTPFIIRVTLLFAGVLLLLGAGISLVSAEPTLNDVLEYLGYTNRTPTTIEIFEPGKYEVTLLAEFAGYHAQNNLSWYAVSTSIFNIIFEGNEGNQGYTSPQITKQFTSYHSFGLCMWSPDMGGINWVFRTKPKQRWAKAYIHIPEQ